MLDWRELRTDLADLVLARSCAGCEAPGSVLCAACWTFLTRGILERELPDGAVAFAATDYLGVGKSVVLAHKEHGWQVLTPFLGALLARAVTSVTSDAVTLVPIPPHAHSRARRGTDPLADIVRAAIQALRTIGQPATSASLILRSRDSGAMKLLGREQRRLAVESSFALSERSHHIRGQIVVVDDVITTGVTVTEALRTLVGAGYEVADVATVASTPLRGLRH